MFTRYFLFPAVLLLISYTGIGQVRDSVYFTTGFKIGELSQNSAVIWTRLCAQEKAVPVKHDRKEPPIQESAIF